MRCGRSAEAGSAPMTDDFEIERDGVRYFQAPRMNPDCGERCDLKRSLTYDEIDVTNLDAGGQREFVQGLAHDTLHCAVHGITYQRRG